MSEADFWQDSRAPTIVAVSADFQGRELEAIWGPKPGLIGRLGSVAHKENGKRSKATAFLMLLAGGLEETAMRQQPATSDQRLLTPEQYNQIFTQRGSSMIFLKALSLQIGKK